MSFLLVSLAFFFGVTYVKGSWEVHGFKGRAFWGRVSSVEGLRGEGLIVDN